MRRDHRMHQRRYPVAGGSSPLPPLPPATHALALVAASTLYQEMQIAAASELSFPFTVSIWFKTTVTTGGITLMSLSNPASGSSLQCALMIGAAGAPGTAGSRFCCFERDGSGAFNSQTAASTIDITSGAWQHGVAIFRSHTSRTVYLNGGNNSTNTGTGASTAITRTSIGRLGDATPSNYFTGNIAEVGIWARELTAPEITALAAGANPTSIKSGIVYYDSCDALGGTDVVAKLTMTNNGCTLVTDHPTVDAPVRMASANAYLPYTFTVNTNSGNVSARQGVAGDAARQFFWTDDDTTIYRWTRNADDSFGSLLSSHDTTSDDPLTENTATGKQQINGFFYEESTGRLIVGASNFGQAFPELGWLLRYNSLSTMTQIDKNSTEAFWTEGAVPFNGYLAMYHDRPILSQYNASNVLQATYPVPGVQDQNTNLFQGGFVLGNDIYLISHRDRLTGCFYMILRWNGFGFVVVDKQIVPMILTNPCGQGAFCDFGKLKAFWACRNGGGANVHTVVETAMVAGVDPYAS